jgi:hypothetical protein
MYCRIEGIFTTATIQRRPLQHGRSHRFMYEGGRFEETTEAKESRTATNGGYPAGLTKFC